MIARKYRQVPQREPFRTLKSTGLTAETCTLTNTVPGTTIGFETVSKTIESGFPEAITKQHQV
jgi:hypothetical protein